jgi:hypothetical protein
MRVPWLEIAERWIKLIPAEQQADETKTYYTLTGVSATAIRPPGSRISPAWSFNGGLATAFGQFGSCHRWLPPFSPSAHSLEQWLEEPCGLQPCFPSLRWCVIPLHETDSWRQFPSRRSFRTPCYTHVYYSTAATGRPPLSFGLAWWPMNRPLPHLLMRALPERDQHKLCSNPFNGLQRWPQQPRRRVAEVGPDCSAARPK